MTSPATIRPATADDAAIIGQLWRELVNYHRQLDEAMPRPTADGHERYAARIEQQLDDPYAAVFVAETDHILVGYVLGRIVDLLPETFEADYGGFLVDIVVLDPYREHGIGRALVNALEDWFQARGISHYEWYVAAENHRARRFWAEIVGGREVMIRMRLDFDANT